MVRHVITCTLYCCFNRFHAYHRLFLNKRGFDLRVECGCFSSKRAVIGNLELFVVVLYNTGFVRPTSNPFRSNLMRKIFFRQVERKSALQCNSLKGFKGSQRRALGCSEVLSYFTVFIYVTVATKYIPQMTGRTARPHTYCIASLILFIVNCYLTRLSARSLD